MGLGRELGCCRGWLEGVFERDWGVGWEGWEERVMAGEEWERLVDGINLTWMMNECQMWGETDCNLSRRDA